MAVRTATIGNSEQSGRLKSTERRNSVIVHLNRGPLTTHQIDQRPQQNGTNNVIEAGDKECCSQHIAAHGSRAKDADSAAQRMQRAKAIRELSKIPNAAVRAIVSIALHAQSGRGLHSKQPVRCGNHAKPAIGSICLAEFVAMAESYGNGMCWNRLIVPNNLSVCVCVCLKMLSINLIARLHR